MRASSLFPFWLGPAVGVRPALVNGYADEREIGNHINADFIAYYRRNPAQPHLKSNRECLMDKTVYVAGNSISRGLYFTLGALLGSNQTAGVDWTNRTYQKMLCQKEVHWPPKPSCSMTVRGTTLVNTWTQRVSDVGSDFDTVFRTYRPDYTVVEVGLDHIALENERTSTGEMQWQVSLKSQFEHVADIVESYFAASPSARLIWRSVTPLNEKLASNKQLTNANVVQWNHELLENIKRRGWLGKSWFQWFDGCTPLVYQALEGQNGLQMQDWIHPDTNTLFLMVDAIIQSACS